VPFHQKPGTFQKVKAASLGCLSNSTGHGLPQIVKPGNLFLNVLWAMFYAVAVSGCGILIYQAVDQYYQFDVITMTKIKRETEMTFPGITICSWNKNTYDMIIECRTPVWTYCQMNNLTLYDKNSDPEYCVQINYAKNDTQLQKAYREGAGDKNSYILNMYKYGNANLHLAITDNSARVVREEVSKEVYFGQTTKFVLSKAVQSVLGPPFSNCNQSSDYRQLNCIEDCEKNAIIKVCGYGYDKIKEIKGPHSNECSYLLYEFILHGQPTEIRKKCNQECPVECKQVSFQSKRVDIEWDMDNKSVDYFKLLVSRKFKKLNVSKYSDDEFKKRMTRLNIQFDKFETTEITQSPSISLTSMIANVGGLLGKSLCLIVVRKKQLET